MNVPLSTGRPADRLRFSPCLPRRSRLAAAALAALALLGTGPASALIVVSGDVTPAIPPGGTVAGGVGVGNPGTGNLTVNGGSSFASDALWLAGGSPLGNGSVTVTGAGSSATVSGTAGGNLDIGGRGTGSLSVSAGATVGYGLLTSDCQINCRVYVSNGAGSSGSVGVSGAASNFSTPGRIVIGNASVFTLATDGFDYGVAGAASTALMQIGSGGVVRSDGLTLGNAGGGNGRLGSESVDARLVIDGAGSAWHIVRAAVQTGAQSLLDLAVGRNTTATLTVSNGGRLSLDGAVAPAQQSGLRVGVGGGAGTTSSATLNVTGAASRLEVNGPGSFINVASGVGSSGSANVSQGGAIGGFGAWGLTYGNVGRDGGTGSLTVAGQDAAGQSSSVTFSGLNDATGGGAFLSIGRSDAAPGANGTVSVLGGGKVEIDMRSVVSANASLLGGFYVGYGASATGTLTVAGSGSVNGAASTFAARGGTGFAPYAAVGRDGGTGTVTVSGGGQLVIESAHASDPNATTNTSGNSVIFDIGRNNTASALASTGTVTVTGAGSTLTLGGIADNYLEVGRGAGGNGTLNVLSGGSVSALDLQIGREAGSVGTLNLSGGLLNLSGTFTSNSVKGRGAIFNVGHAGATATANIGAGSVVNVRSDTGLTPAFTVGGSLNNPGGTGTLNLSGGSVLSVVGNAAAIRIGHTATDAANPGIGTATLSGVGTRLSATGGSTGVAGNIVIGSGAFSSGVVTIGAGAQLSTDGHVGVAYSFNGSTGASTGGTGVLVVNGKVSAPNVYVGAGGYLGGSGSILGNLVNKGGVINPGSSPGTLRVDGGFDNSAGQLVLEVQRQSDGSYLTDQLILGDASQITFGSGQISFRFMGETDPTAFLNTGLFALKTFFREVDGNGNVIPLPDTALAGFAGAQFDAQADAYTISSFSYDPTGGASFSATPVPQPPAAWLLAGGLLLLAFTRRREGPLQR